MSKDNNFVLIIMVLLLLTQFPVSARSKNRVYKESKVWLIIYVKTKHGMFDKYMENLNRRFRNELEMAIKKRQGFLSLLKLLNSRIIIISRRKERA